MLRQSTIKQKKKKKNNVIKTSGYGETLNNRLTEPENKKSALYYY
jgi:hypothetical protein